MVDVHIDVYFTPGGRRGQILEGPLSVVPKPLSELVRITRVKPYFCSIF